VDLEAVAGPFLEGGSTPLNAALLLNGYGLRGWEMVYGSGHGADDLRYIVLKRRARSVPGGDAHSDAAPRRGAALLTGAAVGTLAVGLARLFMADGATGVELEEKFDAKKNGREISAGW
jgi:hypothetical protein